MFNWLFVLLTFFGWGLSHAIPPKKDYIGVVAAEAAYSALLPSRSPVKPPLVDPKDCPTCKGAGKVPSGDGQGWTKCPTCQPTSVSADAEIKVPKSDPERYKSSSPTGTQSAVSK